MINEFLEFESYVTTPDSDSPRLQPKIITDNFGNAGALYDLEHILTTIARGFIFGIFLEPGNIYDEDMINNDLIVCVGKIIFSWLGFECVNNYNADVDAINKWYGKYPDADGWFKKYYEKHCTKKDKEKRWGKIEEKWSESLQGDDYRINVASINNIVSNALELGALKEQCLLIKKESLVGKSQKLKDRFSYLFCFDEKAGGAKPQEKTVERFIKNIAAYLYLKGNHPEGQEFVLLDRIQLLCWYGLDDYKNEAGSWYFKRFMLDKGDCKLPIMTAYSSDRGWNFIKLMIDNDFITRYGIQLIDSSAIDSIDKDKYWIIKDGGHGPKSIFCVE